MTVKHILIIGPPGSGKSQLAQTIRNGAEANDGWPRTIIEEATANVIDCLMRCTNHSVYIFVSNDTGSIRRTIHSVPSIFENIQVLEVLQ